MIKVSIIEDEPGIRKLLRKIIETQDGFRVVSENGDFAGAVTDFTKYRPDVVFVDIDLNGQSGLECAKVLAEWNPKLKVVFATAHSEYMANAFEIYAFDYLVKPFNVERVVKTLSRIKGILETEVAASSGIGKQVCSESVSMKTVTGVSDSMSSKAAASVKSDSTSAALAASVKTVSASAVSTESAAIPPDAGREKLMIKGKEQIMLVDKKDIIMVERCDNATNIVTREEVFKTSAALNSIEEKLHPAEFMRCHKSYIINISRITKIEPYGRWTYVVKLKGTDATALMTAQNYEVLKNMFE